jgi:hypothetical protein
MSTPYSIEIAGGFFRKGESVCQPEPKMSATFASASFTTGWTFTWPSTPLV